MKLIFEKIPENEIPPLGRRFTPNLENQVIWANVCKNVETQSWLKLTGFTDKRELSRVENYIIKQNKANGNNLEIHARCQLKTEPFSFSLFVRKKANGEAQ